MTYTIKSWNNMPNYACEDCVYKTLSKRKMEWHVEHNHQSEPETPPVETEEDDNGESDLRA